MTKKSVKLKLLFFGLSTKYGNNTKDKEGENEKDTTEGPCKPTESETQPKIKKQAPDREPGD